MAKAEFVKYEMTKELTDKVLEALTLASASGKVRRGLNEATKAIERGIAKIVVMAEDVTPEEILMHVPALCEEKEIPYTYVPSKEELGRSSGIDVPTAAVAVIEEGESKSIVAEIVNDIKSLKK